MSTVTPDQTSDPTPADAARVDAVSADAAPVEAAPESEPVMRSTLVGAEMLNWSDLQPDDGRPATGGPVAATLLDAVLTRTDSVLVAGPHSLELIEQLAERAAAVDVLVRSAPDAEEIGTRLAERPVRVFCGALDRFGPEYGEKSYDVVVALDGLSRLVGPDTPVLTWADALAALKDRLSPDGRLLLGAANSFGIERLIQPDVTATVPRDEAWPRDVRGDVVAPAGLRGVRAAVESAGLRVTTVYAVYPELIEPKVAMVDASGPMAAAFVARTVAARFTGPTLVDPYRTTYDAVMAGLGNELAPGWFLVTGAGDVPATVPADALPKVPGELLEELLLAALQIDDQAAIRRTVPGYIDWLGDQAAATAAVAAPDNVLFDGTSYKVFGDAEATAASSREGLAVAQLARFARRAQEAGTRQPWAAGSDPRELTARLASMAGIMVDDELWQTVAHSNELVRPQGSAEQLATIARLAQELTEATAQVQYFEGTLHALRRSKPYRIGLAVMNPARTVYRRVRKRTR